ncbi:GFA family protein [Defluviimonas sp. WL0050]|uniref:GFA family protein n=1 Tax=Albidovulum litorale TaxID=2984134 RepID=A0ABT2ZJP9_9RHOB|nr:GFA family protein [Defluviimonas sp. WL0050]MCV2871263.1 GFA family protein [Defluviimonas sp. WL0050]
MVREATCSCGKLLVRCSGEPELVSACHCTACQKRTGAPFGVAAFFRKERVRVQGQFHTFSRSSDSGYLLKFHFCVGCGSTVFWEPLRKPDMYAIAVGAFGDPDFPAPSQEVYTEGRHAWIAPFVF